MGGWDTDSAGATVGSVCGALTGARRACPPRWVEPLRNRVASSLPGFDGVGFDDLAARTLAVPAPAVVRVMSGAGVMSFWAAPTWILSSRSPGHTSAGRDRAQPGREARAGGKGVNQAVAPARAGAGTTLRRRGR